MKTIDCIKSRRSRRKFLDKEVSDDVLKDILDCAVHAPSSQDCQPWHFVVVKDEEEKAEIGRA